MEHRFSAPGSPDHALTWIPCRGRQRLSDLHRALRTNGICPAASLTESTTTKGGAMAECMTATRGRGGGPRPGGGGGFFPPAGRAREGAPRRGPPPGRPPPAPTAALVGWGEGGGGRAPHQGG